MSSTRLPVDEEQRLQALRRFRILDTEPESAFDDLARLAAHLCSAPTALVTLIDRERQWFKARVGFPIPQIARDLTLCARTVVQNDVLELDETQLRSIFPDNPLLNDQAGIRFYAGTPLVTNEGFTIGTLCVMDTESRSLGPQQKQMLAALGRQVVAQLELRRLLITEAEEVARNKMLQELSLRLVSTLELDEVGAVAANSLRQISGLDRVVIFVGRSPEGILEPVGVAGVAQEHVNDLRLPLDELPSAERAILTNRLYWSRDAGAHTDRLRHAGFSSFAWLPLRVAGSVIGIALLSGDDDSPSETAEEVERTLTAVADIAARALANATAFSERPAQPEGSPNPLSDHQKNILRLVADGLTNAEIGERVHLSRHTVKEYLGDAMRKLEVGSRVEAAVKASRLGLL